MANAFRLRQWVNDPVLNPLKHPTVINNTSQKTHTDYITTINQLMLFI